MQSRRHDHPPSAASDRGSDDPPELCRRTLLLAAGAGAGLGLLGGPAARAGLAPLPVEEGAPGHYLHYGLHQMADRENRGDIANCGFVVGSDAVAVIDSGGSPTVGARLRASVERTTDRPIRYLVNTHMHPDHIFGNGAFADTGAQLVAHARLESALKARTEAYFAHLRETVGADALERARMLRTDVGVSDTAVLDLGDRRLQVQAWPTAHTNNDLSVHDPAGGTVWAGDLAFRTRMPSLDGSALGWIEVLQDLRRLPAELVVPGHGQVADGWPAALDDLTRYLSALVADVRAVVQRFGTIAEAIETAAQDERARWRLFDVYHGRNVTTAFSELEWA